MSSQPTACALKGATHTVVFAATIATASPLAGAIALLGVLAALAYFAWRFGPTIARTTGWCSWWVAWACGSQGGYGYCIAFVVFGALAWGGGTVWYARRRGHWPSTLSARLLPRLLGRRGPLTRTDPPRPSHRAAPPPSQSFVARLESTAADRRAQLLTVTQEPSRTTLSVRACRRSARAAPEVARSGR